MEDVADALLMAGQVLIFIIALTVCISSFTNTRASIDDMIEQTETVSLAKGTQGYVNYVESKADGSIRVVGAETVVSSMYRAIKENYIVYIKLKDYGSLFTGNQDERLDQYTAEKDQKVITDSGTKTIISSGDKLIKIAIGNRTNQQVNKRLADKLYEKIENSEFHEYLGEYQNDSGANTEDEITYRVITYIEK